MANRGVLHKNKLDEFKAFLDMHGLSYRQGKGEYQVLQVLTEKHGWQVIYSRHDMPEHYTVSDKLYPMVRDFINTQKQRTRQE